MKNKFKIIIRVGVIVLIGVSLLLGVSLKELKGSTKLYNDKLNAIADILKNKYELTDNEIMEVIKEEEASDNFLAKYSYDISKDRVIDDNLNNFKIYALLKILILGGMGGSLFLVVFRENKIRKREIKKLVNLVNRINNHDFSMDLMDMGEDELSILRSELYKITVMLRQQADTSLNDKKNLKKYLEDITHQLKTPLTSMLLKIDNILDNSVIEEKQKEAFLRKVRRDIYNMKFLIEAMLKLSKFEVNTISFDKKEVDVSDLIKEAVNNVSVISDLKNVKINVKNGHDALILVDKNWQVEALTNILKNAIEYSVLDKDIDVSYEDNKIYTGIQIINYGKTINKNDLKHLFERFYKGENAREDSVGIGLALAKAIILKDGGDINVTSKDNVTCFTIKYSLNQSKVHK